MAVNINLKEIFAVDNQSDLASKLNFNFNQLIALGVGQPGDKGDTGDAGGPGPIGPIGSTGNAGSVMWSIPSGPTLDLSTASPPTSVIGDYYVGEVTVGLITYTGIFTKTQDGTVWDLVTDFGEIIRSITLDQQPWATGVVSVTPPARIIVPVKNSQGIDRKTIGFASKPANYYESYPPNWLLTTGDGSQNAQGVMFNFDPYTVRVMESTGSAGLNGYNLQVGTNRLGSSLSSLNSAFPYSSILSLYSFYNNSEATIEADQFTSSTGYRHQLELGSIDDLPEYLHTTDPLQNYVISPTYQNLRIRKYRLYANELPGKSGIFVDFNLNSNDSIRKPALNSKFTWSINSKELETQGRNSQVQFALSNKGIETVTSNAAMPLTGIALDGLHLKSTDYLSAVNSIAIGFDLGSKANTLIFKSDSVKSVSDVLFDDVTITAQVLNTGVTLSSIGLTAKANSDLGLYASSLTKEVKIGSSPSNVALSVKGNRLSSAVPFPVSTGTLPPANSSDANTLDEYQEKVLTGSTLQVYFDTLPTPDGGVLTNSTPTINSSDVSGVFTKIGKVVTFSIKFKVQGWTVLTNSGLTAEPYYFDSYSGSPDPVVVGNLATDGLLTGSQHEIGKEAFAISVRGIPDHWPAVAGSEHVKFGVNIVPVTTLTVKDGFLLRPFSMSYSWKSTPAGTWQPMDPSSIYAKFGTYEIGTTQPQLTLHGHRQNASTGRISPMESNLSIYDFLNYVHPQGSAGNVMEVVITGTYITDHFTAQEVHPQGVTTTSTTAGPTTTTTTGPTTTTTTDPFATTTSTTASPTTTTTTGPITTTTTQPGGYGEELVSNADSDYFS